MVARAVDNEAPYFVDYVGEVLDTTFPGAIVEARRARHLHHARPEPAALRAGGGPRTALPTSTRSWRAASAGRSASRRRRWSRSIRARARSSPSSAAAPTTSRSSTAPSAARRQIGSTFKPFVYLAAFEKAADEGTGDITPATLVYDEPTTWNYDNQEWTPKNYDGEYDGAITLRRALAMSRNIAAVKVAEQTGYDRVVALWKKTQVGETDQVKPYPSVALGIVELTPLEVAEAYTVFPGRGHG